MIHKCSELPLTTFIQIITQGKYELLGDGTDEDRSNAWAEIFQEFSEVSGNGSAAKQLKARIAIMKENYRIITLNAALNCVNSANIDQVREIMKEIGTPIRETEPENILKEIKKGIDRAILRQNINIGELKSMEVKGSKPTEKSMYETLRLISRKNGVNVSASQLNTLEYAIELSNLRSK